MLGAEQDHLRHHVIEIGRAERAGEARRRLVVVADADEVDVAFAVDLAAGEEEHVDAALAGAVEQLAPAVGEEGVPPAAEQRHVGPAVAARARASSAAAAGIGEALPTATWRTSPIRSAIDGGEQLLVAEASGGALRSWT